MELNEVLESLSDSELEAISKEYTSGICMYDIHDQLLSKSDGSLLSFDIKNLSNGIVNELVSRLLKRDLEISDDINKNY